MQVFNSNQGRLLNNPVTGASSWWPVPKIPGLFILVFTLGYTVYSPARAQDEDLNVLPNWMEHTDASNSLYHFLERQAIDLLEKRSAEIREITTKEQLAARQDKIRKALMDIVGPFPPKTPLNAKVLRKIDKKNYRIEHIVFESQPGFYVTSSLFIPKGLKEKAPVIIYCSGHSAEGYRSPVYQHVILNLVNKGFIVFAFDPVGQGERLEYYDPVTGHSSVGGPTSEHSWPGAQAFIAGSSQARYMIFDGIRAVDYLLTRKEVDPERIGITGRSGGGTQSAYMAAFDDRISAAAPECYITSFKRLLESIGPQDAEQNFFHGIASGIDHADLLEVRAPGPAWMITTTNDFFSIQGARETAGEVSAVYRLLGSENNFGRAEDIAEHASTVKNREALYAFFQEHLNNPGNANDEEAELPAPDELRVTETGQVSTSLHGETVFSLNRSDAEKLVGHLRESRSGPSGHLSGAVAAAVKLSGYREPEEVNEPVLTGRFGRQGYVIEKYFIKGEGDYVIPYLLFIPDQDSGKALIYLNSSGKNAEASAGGEIEWFVHNGITVLAPDLPGKGETGPGSFGGDSEFKDTGGNKVSFNLWFASILIGRSITGICAGDVVRLVHVMKKMTDINEVCGFADRDLSPVLLHAAAFEPAISRIALKKPFISYASIVMNRFYNPAFIPGAVAGALKAYDLPDLEASLAPRKLLMINITDQMGRPAGREILDKELSVVHSAYSASGSNDNLLIRNCDTQENVEEAYSVWIK